MERTIFLQHYHICLRSDGTPRELSRDGAAITYAAVDERSREPVDLKVIPLQNIDPDVPRQLEEQARAAQNLRHVNIARVFDFGREGGDLVCISEHLPGETLAAWVAAHGPMAADAALRVAEQVVSVLSSASFHKLRFPPIQPSDIIVVPGQTPEGSWPLVKLINFGLPALRSSPTLEPEDAETREQAPSVEQVVNSDQLAHETTDIRSEIYSLGATVYFLLTGVALSADALHRSPKFSGFPKALRTLLGRMLHRDPDQRPKDLVVLAEMIRECMLKIERRRTLADKYGIPYRTTIPRRAEAQPSRLLRIALPVAALLLATAVIAAILFSEPVGRIMHGARETKKIGVLVGVPESSPPQAVQNASTAIAPPTVASQEANSAVPNATQPPVNVATASNSPQVASPDIQQTQTMNAQSPATAPNTSEAPSPPAIAESSASSADEVEPSSRLDEATQPATASQSSSQSKKKSVASTSRRARGPQGFSEDSPQRRAGSVRARVVGITSDGRLVLRLPSGRTAIVAPDAEQDEFMPRRHRRTVIERDEMFARPPRFEPDYFPDD
jgi:serine/threonine protein kinase